MTKEQVISEKLLKQYPESWKIFEDSCRYTVENNLDFIKGALLAREGKISYADYPSVCEQLQAYLRSLGYENTIVWHDDSFLTPRGYEHGVVFVIFLSVAAIKAYIAENEKYSKTIVDRFTKKPERPIYDKIRYINIYKTGK